MIKSAARVRIPDVSKNSYQKYAYENTAPLLSEPNIIRLQLDARGSAKYKNTAPLLPFGRAQLGNTNKLASQNHSTLTRQEGQSTTCSERSEVHSTVVRGQWQSYVFVANFYKLWNILDWGTAEQLQNVKRIRLALVSAPGTPMAASLTFSPLRAIGTLKIGFLNEKWFILTGRMFPNVENMIYWIFVKLFSGVQPTVHLEVSGLSSQVSGVRS